METPQNDLHPEQEHEPEHEKAHTGTGDLERHDGSLSAEEVTAEVDDFMEHEAAPGTEEIRGDKLREAVFAKNTIPEPEVKGVKGEEESVSWWEKVKHSALYGNKQKAEAAKSSNRNKRRQNNTGMLVASVVGVLVAGVWLFTVMSAPVRKPPRQEAPTTQQPQAATQKSLTPGLEAHPNEQQPSGDNSVTAADIRATSNGRQQASSTAEKKPASASEDQDYALGKIPPPPSAPASTPAPPPAPAPQKNPLDTTALVFVRHVANDSAGTEGTKLEPASYQPALALKSQEFDSLVTGTRLVARLETPVSTAVSLPAVATVEYNYEDKDHTLLIPAGSRVFGRLEQADAQGFVGLHFTSIQRLSDPAPIPFEARAIGLDYKPLKGVVTGRNRGRRFLVRAGTGLGQIAAATVGTTQGTGATDALNSNVLIREQVMNNIGSAADQEIQQMAYSEHRVVTLPGNTRFYLVIDHQARPRERRETHEQQVLDSNTSNASVQAQLLELRKELADITAKQTPLASQPLPVPASDTTGINTTSTVPQQ
ncbi:MAG TPA: hypothetical protein VFB14_17685 [Bryobacteraceae bacterium]|jgi:hypothetical protein|nr:hypothetical protein [Bryobacteraceae bacterium]